MLKCMFTKGFVFGIIFLLFGTGLTNVFIEDLVIDAAASPVYSGWNNDPSRFSNLDASLDVIPVDDPQSPLQKYFTTQKILWSLDDYWINSHDYPPHKGYGGLTQRIINYGGYVQINSIFIPDWIGQYYGHAVRV
jgi:hypothetical protein